LCFVLCPSPSSIPITPPRSLFPQAARVPEGEGGHTEGEGGQAETADRARRAGEDGEPAGQGEQGREREERHAKGHPGQQVGAGPQEGDRRNLADELDQDPRDQQRRDDRLDVGQAA
jgi:hypothetical protein